MREHAVAAILDPVGQDLEVAVTVGQIERTVAEQAVHIFQIVAWIVFTASVFKILITHFFPP